MERAVLISREGSGVRPARSRQRYDLPQLKKSPDTHSVGLITTIKHKSKGEFSMSIRSLIVAGVFLGLAGCQADSGSQDAAVIAVAKTGYDAFATGDMEAWAQTQAPDSQWEMPKGFP